MILCHKILKFSNSHQHLGDCTPRPTSTAGEFTFHLSTPASNIFLCLCYALKEVIEKDLEQLKQLRVITKLNYSNGLLLLLLCHRWTFEDLWRLQSDYHSSVRSRPLVYPRR